MSCESASGIRNTTYRMRSAKLSNQFPLLKSGKITASLSFLRLRFRMLMHAALRAPALTTGGEIAQDFGLSATHLNKVAQTPARTACKTFP
jgi:hypothetical protein